MNVVINNLWNANVYLDGTELLGRAAELEVPQPKFKMMEYHGIGMAGAVKLPVGWDALESAIKWSSFDSKVIQTAARVGKHTLMAKADLQVLSASGLTAEYPVTCNMTGIFQDLGRILLKAQENAEIDSVFTVYHVDLSVGQTELYLFDAMSNQYRVNGVDQLAQYRKRTN